MFPGAFVVAFQTSLFASELSGGRTIEVEITGPELEKLVGKDDAKVILKKHLTHEGHQWYFTGMSKEAIDKVRQGYEKRYGKGTTEGM